MRMIFALLAGLVFATGAAAQDGYRIKPGDVLRIEVLEDPNLNRTTLVPPDGRISLPLAGIVQAGGQRVEDVQSALAAGLAPNFATPPNVFVSIEQLAQPAATGGPAEGPTIDVFVIGAATTPGRLEVEPGSTLLQVFAEMGGFTPFAATKRIQLRRVDASGVERVYTFNYDALSRGASLQNMPKVADGDVIVVPERRLFE